MPWNAEQLATIPLELFGGLCSEVEPSVIPEGSSPALQDCEFDVGDVHQRRGLAKVLQTVSGTVNYTKSYQMQSQELRTLLLDSTGNFWYESVTNLPGTLNIIGSVAANCYADSVTSFGREYIAFSDGMWGRDVPRQYDGTFFDRISQVGPGLAGAAADGAAGNISAGVHKFTVMFLTRQGYITAPAPQLSWSAAGSKKVNLTNLPIGPSNVIARVVAFTAAGSSFFFYIPVPTTGSTTGTVINDNTSTTATIDFTDVALEAATSINTAGNNLFALQVLGNCLGAFEYADRTIFWGERNKIQNLLNLSFDGGFDNATNTTPLGWTQIAAGGARSTSAVFGFSYQITSAGVLGTKYGDIQQGAAVDSFNIAILQPRTTYILRLNGSSGVILNPGGNLVVSFTSASTGFSATATIPVNSLPINAQYVSATFSAPTPTVIPADMVMDVFIQNVASTTTVTIDEIEIYPQSQPFLGQQLRVSYAINPESFDGVTGILGLADAGSENIKRCFVIRESLYIQTDGGIYVTQDNGQEPNTWTISRVSNTVGTPSVHGGAAGEEWDVSAHRTGLYMFSGSEPEKINQEIFKSVSGATVAWDQINWNFSFTIWLANDVARRQIFIGVPIGAAQSPNQILMVDYKELNTSGQIAIEGPIHTSYSGKVISWEPGRKWSPWSVASMSGVMIQRQDSTLQLFIGNNNGGGAVYQPTEGQLSDDGAAINGFYTTYAFPTQLFAQQNPLLGTNRQLFSLLTMFVAGAGTLNISTFPQSLSNAGPTYKVLLSATPTGDTEVPIRVAGERVMFRIGTNAVGSSWKLSRFGVRLRSHPWSRIRHVN